MSSYEVLQILPSLPANYADIVYKIAH